jgi:hypothetical protein
MKKKKKSEKNTSRKSETLHREEVEIESIYNNHEEHEDCATSCLERLNARRNKKEKNEASEHLTHQKNDRQCQLSQNDNSHEIVIESLLLREEQSQEFSRIKLVSRNRDHEIVK